MKLLYNVFCRDADAQLAFYAAILGGEEIVAHRSPIYRGLSVAGTELGLHERTAYGLLGLEARATSSIDSRAGHGRAVCGYPTFQLDAPADVDERAAEAASLGGRIVKAPFATYYGQWQAVVEDPEGNVFRLACLALPEGAAAPSLGDLCAVAWPVPAS